MPELMNMTLYILESNFAGNGYYCGKIAKDCGFNVKFIARDPGDYETLEYKIKDCCHQVCQVDSYSYDKLIEFFQDEVLQGEHITAIMAFDDFRVVQAAAMSAIFCPDTGPNALGVLNCRFKDKMRKVFLGTPFKLPFDVVDLNQKNPPSVGFPCILKPVDESGSICVKVCENETEFIEALNSVKRRLTPNIRAYLIKAKALAEAVIAGQEYSAEMLWCGKRNQWISLGYTKKVTTQGKYCAELGHIFLQQMDTSLRRRFDDEVNALLTIVGLKRTVAHVEFKYCESEGLKVIEINPRLAGGHIAKLVESALDINLNQLVLNAHLGKELVIPPSQGQEFWSVAFIYSSGPANIQSVCRSRPIPNVVEMQLVPCPKQVSGKTDGDQRLGYVIRRTSDLKDAESFITNIDQYFKIEGVEP